jgi:hypothetical protein
VIGDDQERTRALQTLGSAVGQVYDSQSYHDAQKEASRMVERALCTDGELAFRAKGAKQRDDQLADDEKHRAGNQKCQTKPQNPPESRDVPHVSALSVTGARQTSAIESGSVVAAALGKEPASGYVVDRFEQLAIDRDSARLEMTENPPTTPAVASEPPLEFPFLTIGMGHASIGAVLDSLRRGDLPIGALEP